MAKVATAGLTVSGVPYGGSVRTGELVGWNGSGKLVQALGAVGAVVRAVGVAAACYENGDEGAMHLTCEVTGFFGLTPGQAQYLSIVEPGGMQTELPVGGGNLRQEVGYSVAADRVAVVFQDAGAVLS